MFLLVSVTSGTYYNLSGLRLFIWKTKACDAWDLFHLGHTMGARSVRMWHGAHEATYDYWVGIFPGCIKVRDMRLLQSVGPVLLTLDLAFSNPKPKWLLRLALHLFKPALASAASQPNFSTFLLVVITTLWGKYYFFILRIKKKIRLKEVKHSIFHSWWVA